MRKSIFAHVSCLMSHVSCLLLLTGSAAAQPPAEKPALGPPARLLNAADVRGKLGIAHQYKSPPLAGVKVAVLDFGFDGVDISRFPPGSTLVEKYDPAWVKANDLGPPDFQKGFEPGNSHGRLMAQALWSVAEGNGPVNALDRALRKDLGRYQSHIKDVELVDYKVRILTGGTEAITRVLVESRDKATGERWFTVGVSPNIVDASFEALVDSINYKLIKGGAKAA